VVFAFHASAHAQHADCSQTLQKDAHAHKNKYFINYQYFKLKNRVLKDLFSHFNICKKYKIYPYKIVFVYTFWRSVSAEAKMFWDKSRVAVFRRLFMVAVHLILKCKDSIFN